ncbi:MAG: phosphatase PAP2 family protein [Calditrichaeota bacterium]|nr:phosphatase PAP2 family protein [Calditrichota bacterium]
MKPLFVRIRQYFQKPSRRWRVYVLLAVVLYFVAINQVIRVRPDHAFVALLMLATLLGKEKGKRFLIDWSPFIVFWTAYDMMRGIADSVRGVINVALPYRVELALFGPLFGGQIPCFFFQHWQQTLGASPLRQLLDASGGLFYTLHFGLPIVLGWYFWHTRDDRRLFYTFVATLTLLNFSALATFMVYPAAPPWYVYAHGFGQPAKTSFWGMGAGGLLNVDRMIGTKFFTTLWGGFNPNHFAAIPSLHGAYPVVIALFVRKGLRWPVPLVALYPLCVWFSAVYLNQHYIIDLLIGTGYVVVAYAVVSRVLMPRVIDPLLARHARRSAVPVTADAN